MSNNNLSIFQVAEWFLSRQSMTHKKLQKLCYYAQAWYVALYDGSPLFKEDMQAWVHGPVSPDLYNAYRQYKLETIPQILDRKIEFSPELEEFLIIVFNSYKKYTANELERLTHIEEPWIEARGSLDPKEPSLNVISLKTMRDYYFEQFKKNQND